MRDKSSEFLFVLLGGVLLINWLLVSSLFLVGSLRLFLGFSRILFLCFCSPFFCWGGHGSYRGYFLGFSSFFSSFGVFFFFRSSKFGALLSFPLGCLGRFFGC